MHIYDPLALLAGATGFVGVGGAIWGARLAQTRERRHVQLAVSLVFIAIAVSCCIRASVPGGHNPYALPCFVFELLAIAVLGVCIWRDRRTSRPG